MITAEESQSRIDTRDLSGDRDMEWTYVAGRLGRYVRNKSRVLDFGCGNGALAAGAVSLGAHVVAIDLLPRVMPCLDPRLEFRQVDLMSLNDGELQFDLVLNCSTVEHVGLSGRYDTVEAPDGDLEAMAKLSRLMKPGGHMLLTLPVGQDAVIQPLHRIYGTERLPRLLERYEVVESSFWRKESSNVWIPCARDEAVAEKGHERYYALGALVLRVSSPVAERGTGSHPVDQKARM